MRTEFIALSPCEEAISFTHMVGQYMYTPRKCAFRVPSTKNF